LVIISVRPAVAFPPDKSLGIAIGDAMGHGIGPALLAAETRAAPRALAPNTDRVEELLTAADHVLRAENGEVHMIVELLGTAVWDYCQPYPPADDFTVIVVKVAPDIKLAPVAPGSGAADARG
jgi:hypothetical protein